MGSDPSPASHVVTLGSTASVSASDRADDPHLLRSLRKPGQGNWHKEEEIINKKVNVLVVVKSHNWWGGEVAVLKVLIRECLWSVFPALTGDFAGQLPWTPI